MRTPQASCSFAIVHALRAGERSPRVMPRAPAAPRIRHRGLQDEFLACPSAVQAIDVNESSTAVGVQCETKVSQQRVGLTAGSTGGSTPIRIWSDEHQPLVHPSYEERLAMDARRPDRLQRAARVAGEPPPQQIKLSVCTLRGDIGGVYGRRRRGLSCRTSVLVIGVAAIVGQLARRFRQAEPRVQRDDQRKARH
jgi:hypothetical protein